MKGLTSIEFVFATVVFVSTLAFILVLIINTVPELHHESLSDSLKTQTYALSDVLLFEKGVPDEWTTETVQMLGLSQGERYVLDARKVESFRQLCTTDTQSLETLLSLDQKQIVVEIASLDGTIIARCGSLGSRLLPEFTVTRLALMNDDFVTVSVTLAM